LSCTVFERTESVFLDSKNKIEQTTLWRKSIKAMILNEYGDNAEFNLTELSQASVKAGHVVVRVAATSVNTVDTMIRQMGNDLPLSPELPAELGMDFAGTIEAVGEGITDFTPGDEVYG
jgi:NADPH2:quinone reductase